MTIFTAFSDGRFDLAGRETRCALGKGGVIEAEDKREGDGCSPLGVWAIRRVMFRPDKGGTPLTGLPTAPTQPSDGWCDAPTDPAYNCPVTLPYPASAERMWRDDDVYDLVGILAHNDAPVVPGLGSAIFLHLARPGYVPTEGCIALSRPDMEALLGLAHPGAAIAIRRT